MHRITRIAFASAVTLSAGTGVAIADEASKPYENHKLVEVMVTLPSQLSSLDSIGESLHCRPSVGW